jgi:hypothetical protein
MKNLAGIILTATLFLFSCTSRVHVLNDTSSSFAKAGSFTWVASRPGAEGGSPATPAYLQEGMRQAVNVFLLNNGWEEVNLDPNYLVVFDVLKERPVSSSAGSVSVSRTYYNPFTSREGRVAYPASFIELHDGENISEAVVFLNIIDAVTDQVAWQGWTVQKVNNEVYETDLASAANTILGRYFKK